ncbi:hypothetical protein TNCV_2421311 [Trichonephila clavipes]|nr:hypothetical protein TNCV_2421311 [Trichonephila clavipes]
MAKAIYTHVFSRSFCEHHVGDGTFLAQFYSNFEGEHSGVVSGLSPLLPFTNLTKVLAARRLTQSAHRCGVKASESSDSSDVLFLFNVVQRTIAIIHSRGCQSGGPRTTSGQREKFTGPQKNVEYTYSSR